MLSLSVECHAEQSRSISSLCFVILSTAKDLEACNAIHRLVDLEILHCVQNDMVGVQNDMVGVQNDIEGVRNDIV